MGTNSPIMLEPHERLRTNATAPRLPKEPNNKHIKNLISRPMIIKKCAQPHRLHNPAVYLLSLETKRALRQPVTDHTVDT